MVELKRYLDEKVRRFSFVDVKLLQLLGAFLAVVVVKLVPGILDLSIWLFLALAILCAAKPCCVFFLGGHGPPIGAGQSL
jgi:hypothetical protein